MLFYGWSTDQWAIAKTYFCLCNKEIIIKTTLTDAQRVRNFWLSKRQDAPGEICIIGVLPILDYGWSLELFENIALTTHTPKFNVNSTRLPDSSD